MKVYLAGTDGYHIECRRRLHSFVHSSVADIDFDVGVGSDIVLDSGAFSAWSLGSPIELQDYINFVHEHGHKFTWYANLDFIADPIGRGEPTPEQLEVMLVKSGGLTWENQLEMERQGLKPLPVFHFREDVKWLKKMLDRYDHIALGGMVEVPNTKLYDWLDSIFTEYLTDNKGMPTYKVHGFGWTAAKVVNRYPWWSVDSSSWIKLSGLGSITVPQSTFKKGKYIFKFDKPPTQYNVFFPAQPNQNSVWSLPPRQRKAVESFLAKHNLELGESVVNWHPLDEPVPEGAIVVRDTRLESIGSGDDPGHGDDLSATHQRIEEVVHPGVSNNLPMRRTACAHYYEDLEDAFEWPRPFKIKNQLERRFFA